MPPIKHSETDMSRQLTLSAILAVLAMSSLALASFSHGYNSQIADAATATIASVAEAFN